jgi:hypothetical protein
MSRVIYISCVRLTEKTVEDWFINSLIENDIQVEYWDIVPLLRESYIEVTEVEKNYKKYIESYSELEELVKKNNSSVYILLINYDIRSIKLLNLLNKHECKSIFILWGLFPIKPSNKGDRVLELLLKNPILLLKKVYYKSLTRIYYNKKIKSYNNTILAAGEEALKLAKNLSNIYIPINTIDYDRFLSARDFSNSPLKNLKYAVFLDINLPFQTDLLLNGNRPVNSEKYYASLNNFFDEIEKLYNLEVVIAAHPKSHYGGSEFNGRKIINNKTAEMVRFSELVISHHSTAITYAILYCKKIIFIYTDDMLQKSRYTDVSYIVQLANYLDCLVFNINSDDIYKYIDVNEINKRAYREFKYNYLATHETKMISTNNIFLSEVKKLLER